MFAQVRDYAAVNVLRTCAIEQGFARLHALRVRNLEIRAPNCRQVKKRPENSKWASYKLSDGAMPVGPHAGIPAQMTRTRKMQTTESGLMRT
jgi:hypothetical protein